MLIKCYNRIMIDVTQDIHSLTTFKRNSSGLMKHMKKTGRPLVFTVKGKAEVVVLDAKVYQEVASQLDAMANIRRGLRKPEKAWVGRQMTFLTTWSAKIERIDDLPRHRHTPSRERS